MNDIERMIDADTDYEEHDPAKKLALLLARQKYLISQCLETLNKIEEIEKELHDHAA